MAELNQKDNSTPFRPQTPGNPSINDEDLEQYGVWVKAGPEDVLEGEEVESPQDFSLQDLETEETEGETAMLSDEEEELLGSLETEEMGIQDMEEDFGLPDELDEVDLSSLEDTDISDFEEKPPEEAGETPLSADSELEEEAFPEIDIDLELEESELETSEQKEESMDIEIPEIDELENTLVLDDVESLPGEEAVSESGELEIGEVKDLDSFEIEEELVLDEVPETEEILEATEVEEASLSETSLPLTDEIEDIDISDIEQSDFGEELPELEIETVGDSFMDTSKNKKSAEPEEESLEIEPIEEEGFSDIEALAEDLGEDHAPAYPVQPSPAPAAAVESQQTNSLLMKIEEELLSIKQELSSLKEELSGLRSAPVIEDRGPAEEEGEAAPAGFFEEDEDETIALTGDELDNILNTADITEETGEGTSLTEESDLLLHPETESDEILIEEENTEREDIIPTEEAPEDLDLSEEIDLSEDLDLSEEIDLEEASIEEPVLEENIEEELPAEEISFSEELDLEEPVLDEEVEILAQEDQTEEPVTEEGEEVLDEIEIDIPEEELSLEEPAAEEEEIESGMEMETLSLEEEGEEEVLEDVQLDLSEIPEDLEGITEAEEEDTILDEVQEIEIEAPMIEPEFEAGFDLEPESETEPEPALAAAEESAESSGPSIPSVLKEEIRSVLAYMDQLLESLPEDKIQEFAESEHFEVYKKLFEELGLKN